MRVVVVEDEIRIREGIQGLLEMMGTDYEFAGSAENGICGLQLIQNEKPDIVITDIRMPDMDGLEMLQQMQEQGISAKAIVISAYSEFEYARQAMRLGVTEYLLKPISVDEFSRAMDHMKMQIEKEKGTEPKLLGTLEQMLGAVLYGQLQADERLEEFFRTQYAIQAHQNMAEVCVYLGNSYEDRAGKVQKEWENFLGAYKDLQSCVVRADYEQSLVIVIYRMGDSRELARRIQCRLLQEPGNLADGSVGFVEAEGIGSLKEMFDTLYRYMDWNLTLGRDVMIIYPQVCKVQTEVCVYPVELENRLKTELCLGEVEQAKKTARKFYHYFSGGKLHTPKDIKECYIRFLWAVINITKEIDLLDYVNLNQQEILDKVMGAKISQELEETAEHLLEQICPSKEQQDNTDHLTVRRMKSMIHEFYQSGITLDEIAQRLNVTPEYLSMQFHREVGETYSSYLRNYRINKAKELLVGTQMKQYEVARQVGYADSKYFGKVFRECTGYSPAEYRKAQK